MIKKLIFSAIFGSLFVLTACQSSQVPVDDGVKADDLAVTTTSSYYKLGTINLSQTKSLYQAEVVAETGLSIWNTAVTTNNAAEIGPDTLTALNDLVLLQQDLAAIESANKGNKAVRAQVTSVNSTITQIEDVLITVLVLEPGLESDIANIQNTTSVTPAQVTADFGQLNTDINNLAELINPPPVTKP